MGWILAHTIAYQLIVVCREKLEQEWEKTSREDITYYYDLAA